MKDLPITISTIKAARPWDGTLFKVPAHTMIDVDPVTRQTRFTEPNGCRYLLKCIKYATCAPDAVTITAGLS